ncbi:uncharacterized protein LOC116137016 [Pistacia vera]|uniref:uncharacterized protein LOC116137016 n=1 Tax=Pistacia vera TaxID=55513 RepID=UPI001263484A|nr:uncharacterized protein LOC116137016 [Pistacia vera]
MEFKHFSHPHNLRIYNFPHQNPETYTCSGCESIISGSAYACFQCMFFLHQHCGNAQRAIQHQSHPMHHLTLLPSTTYSAGSFICNACGRAGRGNSFSFCCPLCDFDLHLQCASLPENIKREAHFHGLCLSYGLPQPNNECYNCDVCHKLLDQKFWSYNCFACNFHVHTSCAIVDGSVSGASQNRLSDEVTAENREDPVLNAQTELQRLQHELQMAQELAKMMASFNLSSLV